MTEASAAGAKTETLAEAITRFAEMSDADFLLCKKDEAEKFGISAAELKELRKNSIAAARKAKKESERAAKKKPNGADHSTRSEDDGYISFGPYVSSWKGLFYQAEADDNPTRLTGPLKVLATTEDGAGNSWGVLLSWADKAGHQHTWAMPLRMLAGELNEVKARLLDEGLEVSTSAGSSDRISAYLQQANPKPRAQCVAKTGWCNGAFVTRAKVYSKDEAPGVVFQSEGYEAPVEIRGTLPEWKEHIGKLAVGNDRLQFSICVALTGPLLSLTGEESGGFHITGASSIGKTSILHAAFSVAGAPVRSWRTTDNSLESWAAESNDGLLILDELSQVDAKAAENIAYMLGNGQGKGRANRSGVARRVVSWRTIMLSSGEIGMAEKLNEGGKRHKAGQAARMVEFPADAGAGLGAFQKMPGGMSPAEFAQHLKQAAAKYCGVALDEFLTRLVADDDAAAMAGAMREAWLKDHVAPNSDGQVRRIAGRFALVAAAGELAIVWGILPWEPGSAAYAAKVCFDAAVKARGGVGALEIERGIDQVRAFIAAHGASRFENPKDYEPKEWTDRATNEIRTIDARPPKTINRAGWREQDGDEWNYFILATVWRKEVCEGFNATATAKALHEKGLLRADSEDRWTRQKRGPDGASVKVYHVLGRILSDDEPAKGGENG